MPAALSYPGVYIEEVPSGVRTISGVATSIALFIGWAPKGPVDKALRLTSYADFERAYGGLHPDSLLGYAVNQFYDNGGSDAYVIRIAAPEAPAAEESAPMAGDGLAEPDSGEDEPGSDVGGPSGDAEPPAEGPKPAATAKRTVDGLIVEANSPGAWGNRLKVTAKAVQGLAGRVRVEVRDWTNGDALLESFTNLSLTPGDARFAPTIVNAQSAYLANVRLAPPAPESGDAGDAEPEASPESGSPPPEALTGGEDGTILAPTGPTANAFNDAVKGLFGSGKIADHIDLFNIVCVPGLAHGPTIQQLQTAARNQRAFLLVDCDENATVASLQGAGALPIGSDAANSAFYFPWVRAPDPLQSGALRDFPPCGFVAGVLARTDAQRGVWKAPAGTDANLNGSAALKIAMSDAENGQLNPKAINCLRDLPVYGRVVWGARTLYGDNDRGSEWKYVPVRRMALFLEESLYRGTQWVVFEPNDEPLWAQIRLNIGAFLQSLFRQGAFQGKTPKEAYFVKCDRETTTQTDINNGIVNILVGFAPLKPAEFVVIKIQQMAGDIPT